MFFLEDMRELVATALADLKWLIAAEDTTLGTMHFFADTDNESVSIQGVYYGLSDEAGAYCVARMLHRMITHALPEESVASGGAADTRTAATDRAG